METSKSLQYALQEKWNLGLTWHAFLQYSQKNVGPMKTNYDSAEIDQRLAGEIKGVQKEIRLLAIGADWCGDCVATMPVIARLADLNPKIEYRIVDRDRHEDLMDQFLTNGARSIPKVIVAPANFERHGTWGARPAACQAIMTEHKGKLPKEEIIPMIRAWYANDKGRTTVAEIWAEVIRQAG